MSLDLLIVFIVSCFLVSNALCHWRIRSLRTSLYQSGDRVEKIAGLIKEHERMLLEAASDIEAVGGAELKLRKAREKAHKVLAFDRNHRVKRRKSYVEGI